MRNREGVVVAGLIGKTFWNWLHIDYLWVEESLRDQQLGKELVALAESEAKNRGCVAAVVDTFEFQAKGFYEKLGYICFAELDGFAGEHKRFYFRKHLA